MQFHHHGYVSGDPRVQFASGVGLDRPEELPDEVDVLVVGAGPAGMIAAAQLSQFPNIVTRIVEKRSGRLDVGQADGIQARSMETFEAFGFANKILEESHISSIGSFWQPDDENPGNIVRGNLVPNSTRLTSEYPEQLINQARILDYLGEAALNSPTRLTTDYGYEFVSLEEHKTEEYPLEVTLRQHGEYGISERIVRAKYVIGCDGSRSRVRDAIGGTMIGGDPTRVWGVMDVLGETDFPDIRVQCSIQSTEHGSILCIPREGGFLVRLYVDLGPVTPDNREALRNTPQAEVERRANLILHPYSFEVREVCWRSVYEVRHRLVDRFDNRTADGDENAPRVFITGDACHVHSANAGQGMNVSMQDGWNIAWKIAHVLEGLAPVAILDTYEAERSVTSENLVNIDREWSILMASSPEENTVKEREAFHERTGLFLDGFATEYQESLLTASTAFQDTAPGFPIGKRFRSRGVIRVCDHNPIHLGHNHTADGRWRVYVFADGSPAGDPGKAEDFATWYSGSPDSPLNRYSDGAARFDIRVVYQQAASEIDINKVPAAYRPKVGKLNLTNWETVFSVDPQADIFDLNEIDRNGAVVIVRPDQYVAQVLPLDAHDEFAAFFARSMR